MPLNNNNKMKPSIDFLKLMEDTRKNNLSTSNNISEDKDTRQKKREERRQERKEEKFGGSDTGGSYDDVSSDRGEFKIPAFVKALEAIKNQIIAQLIDTDTTLKSTELGGKKTAKKYKTNFLDLLDRVAKLIAEGNYRREKEGKKLEDTDPNDKILIKGYRENYNGLKNDFKKSLDNYTKEINTEKTEYGKDLKYKEIVNPIEEARELFTNALSAFANITREIKISSPSTVYSDRDENSSVKVESTIKKGTGTKSKPDEATKKVQDLILTKFKNKESVTKTQEWKTFSKYGSDGVFGNATGNLIKLLKAGFGMDDKTSDITKSFVDELNSLKESNAFLKFEEFLKMNEAWSDEAFNKAVVKKSEEKKTPSIPADVQKLAKEKKDSPADKKEGEDTGKEEENIGDSKEAEDLLIKGSDAIVDLFSDASFWEEFKGEINDDEDAAAAEFKNWFDTTLMSKYLKKAIERSGKVKDAEHKKTLEKNIQALKDSKDKISKRILGDFADDNFYWKLYLLDGSVKSYKVDTDF